MYTQVLKVEIDGCHPEFYHRHTPGIAEKLREIADELERSSVQMRNYPFYYLDNNGGVIAKVDLVETENEEVDENGDNLGVPSLKVDEKDLHLLEEYKKKQR